MSETHCIFEDNDLLFLVRTLMPDYQDPPRMVRVLKEDEDILEGMLNDDQLFKQLMEDPETLIRISPRLFFTILLNRVKINLGKQSYTIEQADRHLTIVFDSRAVVELLKEKRMRNYLADMLVSFVRINSLTMPIRIRKGIWRKIRFSDFDIESLIRYNQAIDESRRFQSYKRIADICLFTSGIFPDYIDTQQRHRLMGKARPGGLVNWSRDALARQGQYFYKAAAQHRLAPIKELDQILLYLSENFILVTKPLILMADRFLGAKKDHFFLR